MAWLGEKTFILLNLYFTLTAGGLKQTSVGLSIWQTLNGYTCSILIGESRWFIVALRVAFKLVTIGLS